LVSNFAYQLLVEYLLQGGYSVYQLLIRFAELFLILHYLFRAENFYFKINLVVIVNPAAGNVTILGNVPSVAGSPAGRLVSHTGPGTETRFKRYTHVHAPFDFFEVNTMNGFNVGGKQCTAGLYYLHAVKMCG
jgi:hypothetical protein